MPIKKLHKARRLLKKAAFSDSYALKSAEAADSLIKASMLLEHGHGTRALEHISGVYVLLEELALQVLAAVAANKSPITGAITMEKN